MSASPNHPGQPAKPAVACSRGRRAPDEPRMIPKRHHLLLVGLLLFMAGVQFRLVESFTLNERSTRLVATEMGGAAGPAMWQGGPIRKVVEPPRWLGLALMSAGAVLTVKSLAMRGAA